MVKAKKHGKKSDKDSESGTKNKRLKENLIKWIFCGVL